MLKLYMYLFLILIICFILIKQGIVSIYAPFKIKIMSLLILIIVILRYVSCLILIFKKNISYLYLLKPFIILYVFYTPIIAVIILHIFYRKNKITIGGIVASIILSLSFYVFSNINLNYLIELYEFSIYKINYANSIEIKIGFIVLNMCFLFIAILGLNKNCIDKKGMYIVIGASFFAIIETIINGARISLFPQHIIGDVLWLIGMVYGLEKIKRVR